MSAEVSVQRAYVPIYNAGLLVSVQRAYVPIYQSAEPPMTGRRRQVTFVN